MEVEMRDVVFNDFNYLLDITFLSIFILYSFNAKVLQS